MHGESLEVDDHESTGNEKPDARHHVGGHEDRERVREAIFVEEEGAETGADCSDRDWGDCGAKRFRGGTCVRRGVTYRLVEATLQ